MKVGDLVRVRVGDARSLIMFESLHWHSMLETRGTLRSDYYVPVQIGNVNDLYNIERVKVISESR